eukprot:Pgem_evm1s3259
MSFLTIDPSTTTPLPSSSTTTNEKVESIPFSLPTRLFDKKNTYSKLLIKSVDCHAGGEPARIIFSGVPEFPKQCTTALLKRSYMMENLDYIRQVLLLEPRGYPCQNVDYVFQCSITKKIQYVIGEQNQIYPLMSGHNTICTATAVLECGVIPMQEPITKFVMEAPAGDIQITAFCENGKAKSIKLINAPSFVEKLDVEVLVPKGIGKVVLDIAYGGMWYAIVDIAQFEDSPHLNLKLDSSNGAELCRVGEMIKVACREQFPVVHPIENYPGVDILVFRGQASKNSGAHAKNCVIMSNCELDWNKPETWTAMIDRSPCGTGTCAVMASMYARKQLEVGVDFIHESIVGSKFTGKILKETRLEGDGRIAIIPEIVGSACITQYSEIVIDNEDPFPN